MHYILECTDGLTMLGVFGAKWLSARKNKLCFVIFSINAIYWIIRNFYLGLHVAPTLGFINIAINIYGYIYWTKGKVFSKA